MNKVVPLLVFGIGLIAVGLYWKLFDDSLIHLNDYILRTVHYQLYQFIWDVLPFAFLAIGVFCLIAAGVSQTREVQV